MAHNTSVSPGNHGTEKSKKQALIHALRIGEKSGFEKTFDPKAYLKKLNKTEKRLRG